MRPVARRDAHEQIYAGVGGNAKKSYNKLECNLEEKKLVEDISLDDSVCVCVGGWVCLCLCACVCVHGGTRHRIQIMVIHE